MKQMPYFLEAQPIDEYFGKILENAIAEASCYQYKKVFSATSHTIHHLVITNENNIYEFNICVKKATPKK